MSQNQNYFSNKCQETFDEYKCDDSLKKPLTNKDCEDVNSRIEELKVISKYYTENNPFNIFTNLVKAFGSNNELNQKMRNIINNVQKSITTTDTQQKCDNLVSSIQQNIIQNSPECIEKNNETLKIILPLLPESERLDFAKNFNKISDITQENISTIRQQCVLNSIMESIKKQDVSIESIALAEFMQQASGMLANNKSSQDLCTIVNSEQTTCDYLKTRLCCSNIANLSQTNILDCAFNANNIQQLNNLEILQVCNLTGATTVDTNLISKSSAKTKVSGSQKAVGIDFFSAIIGLVIFLVLFIGAPLLFAGGVIKKLIPMILILVAFGFVFYGLLSKKKIDTYKPGYDETVNNIPLFKNENCESNSYGGDIGITYEDAFNKCLNDENCVGLDFSHSKKGYQINENAKNKNEPFNIYGVSLYFDKINSVCRTSSEDIDEKNTYYTGYKSQKSDVWLNSYIFIIFGIILFIMGIVILFSLKKKSEDSSKNTNLLSKKK